MKTIVAILAALATFAAHGVTITTSTGNLHEISYVSDNQTGGPNMAGMEVWVSFADGSRYSAIWSSAGSAVLPNYFDIATGSDTYSGLWRIRNFSDSSIVGFGFNGAPGGVVFDKSFQGTGTRYSGEGKDLMFNPDRPATILYTDIVAIAGEQPLGDVFASLQVDMANSPLAGRAEGLFYQDTDKVYGQMNRVPEAGSTAILLGLSMAGLFALPRRKL